MGAKNTIINHALCTSPTQLIFIGAMLFILFLSCPALVRATDTDTDDTTCPSRLPDNIFAFTLPRHPVSTQPVRLLALSADGQTALSLAVRDLQNNIVASQRSETWGYVPRATSIWFEQLAKGEYHLLISDATSNTRLGCVDFSVGDPATIEKEPFGATSGTQVWPVTADWSVAMEDLYSVFVAKLFHVERGASKGWRPLGRATRDPYRNILYGIMGYDEDNAAAPVSVVLSPDCADAPMQVRSYFAWKMGLPMLLNECTRGTSLTGPGCYDRHDNLSGNPKGILNPVARFNRFIETTVNWKTHAGIYRTLPDDEDSAVYPIALTPESLRPGTVFVDAGGHIILVSQVEPQGPEGIGTLYGVDGHPDFTVTHKAFSSGTFVFNHRVPTDGFKAFRPVVWADKGVRFIDNDEIATWRGLPEYSAEQSTVSSTDQFYMAVQKALNPRPIDPLAMLRSKVDVLHNALKERIEAVQLGVAYMQENFWHTMAIPDGPAIFQTIGPWEIYSTPARDMRLLLVIDDVMNFPRQVAQYPDLYVSIPVRKTDGQGSITSMLDQMLTDALAGKTVTYIRSDQSQWTLTLADIVARRDALEMGYNPNDCPEVRWGAPPHSEERSTCTHRTPLSQLAQMQNYRKWFIDRHRPDQR